jgi:hypothetical protein
MAMSLRDTIAHAHGMVKRTAVAVLWFLSGWTVGNALAIGLGLPTLAGPVLGLVAATVFAGDPLGKIWARRAELAELPAQVADAASDTYAGAA